MLMEMDQSKTHSPYKISYSKLIAVKEDQFYGKKSVILNEAL